LTQAASFALKKYVKEYWSPFFASFKGPEATSFQLIVGKEAGLARVTNLSPGNLDLLIGCESRESDPTPDSRQNFISLRLAARPVRVAG
jgi:hypothetical protein